MDYEEFEYIYCGQYIQVQKSADQKHLVFKCYKNDKRTYEIAEKYKDMSPEEFDKICDPHYSKMKALKHKREFIINEFKSLKPTDFKDMPQEQKFKYLDALAYDNRRTKEWEQDFSGADDNIQACLFSIKADKSFWVEEYAKVNLFISALIGVGLADNIKNANKRTSEQKKEDIYKFIDLFCKVYDTPRPEVVFRNPALHQAYCETSSEGKSIRLADDLINKEMQWHYYDVIFHEMIHVYQHTLFDKDPEKNKMFSPWYNRLKFGTWCTAQGSIDEKYKIADKIYELLPIEAHAYSMGATFGTFFSERILGRNAYHPAGLAYRNIYFGWTMPSYYEAKTLSSWHDYQGR